MLVLMVNKDGVMLVLMVGKGGVMLVLMVEQGWCYVGGDGGTNVVLCWC